MKRSIWCVVGTRPEVIKMAPVIRALKARKRFDVKLVSTAQHRDLLDQMLRVFDLRPDIDLDLMRPDQSLADLTGRVLSAMDARLRGGDRPEAVLVQGDTTTVMATALACFYRGIRVGHVEAGLRSGDLRAPFPEEMNRRTADLVSEWLFAPTPGAALNLKKEGVPTGRIHVTGNTVIDALRFILRRQTGRGPRGGRARTILLTCHRRENFGEPIRRIFRAVRELARRHPDVQIRYPVHPNPNVKQPATEILGGVPNIALMAPMDYAGFVREMDNALFIISDSGGVQEEATVIGKRVLLLRDVTERPESVKAGFCTIVGADPEALLKAAEVCLKRPSFRAKKAIYGDGHAGERIARILERMEIG